MAYDFDKVPDSHPGWGELMVAVDRIWQKHRTHGTHHLMCDPCRQLRRELAREKVAA